MRYPSIVLLFFVSSSFAQGPWTLEQCVSRAEAKNLAIRSASYDRDFAAVGKQGAQWGFLPNLNAAATHGYNWGQTIDRYTNTFATDRVRTNNFYLGSDWMLFGGLSQQNQFKQAKLDNLSAEEGLAAARIDVLTAVSARFMEMLSSEERIRAATVNADRTREQITLTEAMVEAGRTARVELLDIRSQLAREEYDIITAENQYQQASLRMAQLLQLTPQEAASFSITAPTLKDFRPEAPIATVEQVMQRVLETHPAYKRRQLNVESAERGVEIARAGGIPSLRFSANVASGYSGRDEVIVGEPIIGSPSVVGFTASGEDVFTPSLSYNTATRPFGDQLKDNVNYSASWTLSIPLFNNMNTRTASQQARIRYEQARLQQTDQEQQLQLSVQQAIADQRAAYRQFLAATNAYEASNESVRYANERFEQGAVTALELSTAKANLNRSNADMITARYSYLMALKSLEII
ncbi:MAG TPA: TolC family protein, partial [Flavobacteriales bacterium]|nr:TolC family protein [Flavobacteriales bacterium]HQW07401.1 TolC family protein [Flavobacteriales bacterium]HQX00436.1 TolC family protein [Flavobacteriales bacterium]HQY00786.1 TolC family protein [Flavobacteriales bacterium]